MLSSIPSSARQRPLVLHSVVQLVRGDSPNPQRERDGQRVISHIWAQSYQNRDTERDVSNRDLLRGVASLYAIILLDELKNVWDIIGSCTSMKASKCKVSM